MTDHFHRSAGSVEAFTPNDAWDELVNKDDRTSPEEYPEMCLISFEELMDYMERHVPDAAQGTRGNLSDDIEYAIRLAREDRANNAIEYLIWMGRKYAQPPAAPAAQGSVTQVLEQAKAALLRMRTASIAGCEEGYGKPEKWADELFASHGTATAAIKAIDAYLASQPPAAPYRFRRFVDGVEMADGVEIAEASSVQEAFSKARRMYGRPAGMDLVLEYAQLPAAPVDLINRLRSMPSSLNDALRTMEEAADFLAGVPAARDETYVYGGDGRSAPVETAALDPLSMLLDAALYAQSIKPEWAKAARRAVATARAVQRSSAGNDDLFNVALRTLREEAPDLSDTTREYIARTIICRARHIPVESQQSAGNEHDPYSWEQVAERMREALTSAQNAFNAIGPMVTIAGLGDLTKEQTETFRTRSALFNVARQMVKEALTYRAIPNVPQGAKVKPCGDADTCVCEIVGRTTCIHQPSESLQCLRCGTVDAFGPVSKEKK